LLRAGLDLRDCHAGGEISRHGLAVACGRLEKQLSDLVFPPKTDVANERLAQTCGLTATTYSRSYISRA